MKQQTRIALDAHKAATQAAARQANAGFDAVPILKRQFAAVLGAERVTIGEDEFRAYIAASAAIVHNKLALANLGVTLVDMLMEHFKRQIDAAARVQQEAQQC